MDAHDTTTGIGRRAETVAARLLARHGVTLLERNFRCRGGEIDLIGRDAGTLVFVEVRLRRHPGFGGAASSITRTKQRRIVLAAQHYLARHGLTDAECRFDCVLLDALGDGLDDAPAEWIRNAFDAQ